MAAIRATQGFARAMHQTSNAAFATVRPDGRRFLSSEAPLSTLYSTNVKVVGMPMGHITGRGLTADHVLPKALGGPGGSGKTDPEELFAAGYSTCFLSSMYTVAASMGIKLPTKTEDSSVETKVDLFGNVRKLDLRFRVDMKIKIRGVAQETLEKIVARSRDVCPYSRSTKDRVITNIEVMQM